MKIITNNVPRPIIYGWELTEKERQEFDYMKGYELDMNSFFRYREEIYSLSDFTLTPPGSFFQDWDGIKNDSFFSAIVIRLNDCGDAVTAGLFLS